MDLFPKSTEQAMWAYEVLLILITTGTAFFLAPWAPFVVIFLWTMWWAWNLHIAPKLYPEEASLSEEEKREVEMARFAQGQNDRLQRNLDDIAKRVIALENQERPLGRLARLRKWVLG